MHSKVKKIISKWQGNIRSNSKTSRPIRRLVGEPNTIHVEEAPQNEVEFNTENYNGEAQIENGEDTIISKIEKLLNEQSHRIDDKVEKAIESLNHSVKSIKMRLTDIEQNLE